MHAIPVKELYTVQDVCIILNTGAAVVYGAIKHGEMRGVLVDGRVNVSHIALKEYLQQYGNATITTIMA